MLTTRTRLAYEDSRAAIAAAPRVAEIMAERLRWSGEERTSQLEAARLALMQFGGPAPHQELCPREIFRSLDADGDNNINLDQMKQGAAALGLPFASEEEAKQATEEAGEKGEKGRKEAEEIA